VGDHRGLAVATRAAPRFTQDVDFAVSVANDAEAEDIVHRLSVRGYAVGMMLEQALLAVATEADLEDAPQRRRPHR
jgi:hypothetical protein